MNIINVQDYKYGVFQKSVTIVGICHFHNNWRERLYFGHLAPNISHFIGQKFKSNAPMVFTPEEKIENVLFWYENKRQAQYRRLCGECGMEFRDLSWCILISMNMSLFETTGTVRNTHKISDQHHLQTPEGHRCRTESTIFRHDMPLRLGLVVWWQMRMLRGRLSWS